MDAPDIWLELSKTINTNTSHTKDELSSSENPSLKRKGQRAKIIIGVMAVAVTVCVAVGIASSINKNNTDKNLRIINGNLCSKKAHKSHKSSQANIYL